MRRAEGGCSDRWDHRLKGEGKAEHGLRDALSFFRLLRGALLCRTKNGSACLARRDMQILALRVKHPKLRDAYLLLLFYDGGYRIRISVVGQRNGVLASAPACNIELLEVLVRAVPKYLVVGFFLIIRESI